MTSTETILCAIGISCAEELFEKDGMVVYQKMDHV